MALDTPQYLDLTAGVAGTVTFNRDADLVRVTSVDGASVVYFTADGVTAPAVKGPGNFFVPAIAGDHRTVGATPIQTDNPYPAAPTFTTKVQLIAAVATTVCVEGLADADISFEG